MIETDARRDVVRERAVKMPGISGSEVVIAFGVATMAFLLLCMIVGSFFAAKMSSSEEAMAALKGAGAQTAILAAEIAAIGLGVGLVMTVRRRGFAAFGLRSVSGRWLLFGGVGAGLLGIMFKILAGVAYVTATGDESNPQEALQVAMREAGVSAVLPLFLFVGLLVPLAEEVLFRGILYSWLRRWGVPVAVAVSALVFGAFHGLNFMLFGAAAIGVINALLYEKSGSLWPAIVAHAVNNALAAILIWIAF